MIKTCKKKLYLIVAMTTLDHEKSFCLDLVFGFCLSVLLSLLFYDPWYFYYVLFKMNKIKLKE